jgi:hypothetical protein
MRFWTALSGYVRAITNHPRVLLSPFWGVQMARGVLKSAIGSVLGRRGIGAIQSAVNQVRLRRGRKAIGSGDIKTVDSDLWR